MTQFDRNPYAWLGAIAWAIFGAVALVMWVLWPIIKLVLSWVGVSL